MDLTTLTFFFVRSMSTNIRVEPSSHGQYGRKREFWDIANFSFNCLGLQAGALGRSLKQQRRQPVIHDRQISEQGVAADRPPVVSGDKKEGIA